MNNTLFILSQLLLMLIAFALVASINIAIRYTLKKRGVKKNRQDQIIMYITTALLFWLTLLAVLAYSGFFLDFTTLPPKILLAVLPMFILITYLLFSKSFSNKVLRFIPQKWLVYIQSFRIVMELFLWLGFIVGYIPFQMTFEGLNFDIIVGITALMAGSLFFKQRRYRRFEAIIWNISGLLLLINIVVISVISTPSPFRIFMNEPANTMIAYFPFIWIPGFIVPFALAMHLFSLKQLIVYGKDGFLLSNSMDEKSQ